MTKPLWALVCAASVVACGSAGDDQGAATAGRGTDNQRAGEPVQAATVTAPQRTPAPGGARVFIVSPPDGATVSVPLTVEFGAENVEIAPAGTAKAGSGHHHLIVDAPLPDLRQPIPASERYIHFGDGSTSTVLDLAPGPHRLQLLLGDHLHRPHEPPVYSKVVSIVVE